MDNTLEAVMTRLGLGLTALILLGGCGGGERAAIKVRVEAGSDAATIHCVDSTSGLCHVAFAAPAPPGGEIRKGESRRFAGVAPGMSVCIEAEPVDPARCNRIAIKQGTQTISRSRTVS